jgi:hypothetical protein
MKIRIINDIKERYYILDNGKILMIYTKCYDIEIINTNDNMYKA